MSTDARIESAIIRWGEGWAGGAPPLGDLVRDNPDLPPDELRARADRFVRMMRFLDQMEDAPAGTAGGGESPPPAEGPPAPLPTAPGFEVVGLLGAGGMGVVYRARQLAPPREVALKMIARGDLATPAERRRFVTEAQAVARLQHPHVVQVFAVGEHGGRPYMALELCPGGSLRARVEAGRPTPRQAAAWFAPLARAVHHAHSRGVIHRDLTPGNVLFAAGDAPKVADFGLARLAGPDGVQSDGGDALGAAGFVSPEQALGDTGSVGPMWDVYGLGASLYYALTGRPPFVPRPGLTVAEQVLRDEPAAPRSLRREVPRDLEVVCLKCLRKGPEERYASAEALAEDLERFLRGEPVLARPVSSPERAWKWARRRPAAAALLLVSLVAAAALLAGWLHFTASLAGLLARAREAEGEAVARAEAERAAREEADESAEALRLEAGLDDWRRHDLISLRGRLGQAPPRFAGAWEQRHVEGLARRRATPLAGHRWGVRAVAFTQGGARVVTAAQDRTARRWDAGTGRELGAVEDLSFSLLSAAVSPDGRHFVWGGEGETAQVRSFETGGLVCALKRDGTQFRGVAFSPDGRRVVSVNTSRGKPGLNAVCVFDARSGGLIASTFHREGPHCVACLPDGQTVAFGAQDGRVWLWAPGGAKRPLEGRHEGPVQAVACSPDGGLVASAGVDGGVMLRGVTAGGPKLSLPRHPAAVCAVAFSADGRRLATGSQDGVVHVWGVADGGRRLRLRGHKGAVQCVAFSPDGRRLASGDVLGKALVWAPGAGQDEGAFPVDVGAVAFAPDGGRLLVLPRGAGASLWDARTGEARPVMGHGQTCAAFSGDGRLAVSGGEDGSASIWGAGAWGRKLSFPAHRSHVSAVAFAPGGRWVASGGGDGTLKVWGVDGRLRFELRGHQALICGLAFSPDGARLASADGRGKVALWGAGSGRLLAWLDADRKKAYQVAFSPDGRRLATAGAEDGARVWDVGSGRLVHSLKRDDPDKVGGVAFSPDGRLLATAGEDGVVRLWGAATGRLRLALEGHAGRAGAVAFTPDGERILSVGGDGKVRVWGTGR